VVMLSPSTGGGPKQPLFRQPAFLLAVTYTVIAALWIVLSDLLVAFITPSPEAMEVIEAIKGGVFVIVTGIGLYFMVRRMLESVRQREHFFARQQQEHQAQLNQYRVLLEAADDLVVLIDTQKHYQAVPERAANMIGLTAQQMTGKTPRELFDSETARSMEQAIEHVVLTRQAYRLRRYMPNHPKLTWMNVLYSPVFAEDGSVRAILSIGRDVTEQTIGAEKLAQRTEQYRTLLDTISLIGQTLRRDEVLQGVLDRMQTISS